MASLLQQFRGFSKNARLLLVTVVCAGMNMALNTLFLNFYLQRLGLSQQLIGVVNALPAVVLVVVGFPVGRLVDRYGPRRGLLLGAGLAVVGSAGVAASGTASAILVFSALLGVGSAFGFISVAPFQMASSTERDRVALFSAQAALMTGTSFVGNLLGGSTFSGWWRGRVGFQAGFDTAFAPMTVLYVMAIGLTYVFFVRGRAPQIAQVQEART